MHPAHLHDTSILFGKKRHEIGLETKKFQRPKISVYQPRRITKFPESIFRPIARSTSVVVYPKLYYSHECTQFGLAPSIDRRYCTSHTMAQGWTLPACLDLSPAVRVLARGQREVGEFPFVPGWGKNAKKGLGRDPGKRVLWYPHSPPTRAGRLWTLINIHESLQVYKTNWRNSVAVYRSKSSIKGGCLFLDSLHFRGPFFK